MITIRYHKELYAEDAVTASAEVFRDYANIAMKPTDTHFELQIEPFDTASGEELVAEMNNHILGHTIELQNIRPTEGRES